MPSESSARSMGRRAARLPITASTIAKRLKPAEGEVMRAQSRGLAPGPRERRESCPPAARHHRWRPWAMGGAWKTPGTNSTWGEGVEESLRMSGVSGGGSGVRQPRQKRASAGQTTPHDRQTATGSRNSHAQNPEVRFGKVRPQPGYGHWVTGSGTEVGANVMRQGSFPGINWISETGVVLRDSSRQANF